jgi:sulfate transport system permease protein
VVKELIPVMQKLGTEQEEAAYMLGAGRVTAFVKVTLPALKWSIIYGALMTTARSLGEFGAVLVVSGNIIMQTETATLYIYQSMADFNLAGAYAVSIVLVAFSIIALVMLRLLNRGREEASI